MTNLPLNTINNMDFMQNDLPDKCAQLIIADPPYFEVRGAFDFVWSSFKEYLHNVELWAKECHRILADNGTLFWYGSARKIAYTQVILDKHMDLINSLVWDKGSFMGLEESEDLRSFAPCSERLLMYGNEHFNMTQALRDIRDEVRLAIHAAHGQINLKAVNEVLGTATNGGGGGLCLPQPLKIRAADAYP